MIPGVIILLALVFSLLVPTLPHYGFGGFSPLTIGLIFVFVSYIVSFLRPCKSLLMNMSISFHLLLMGVISLSIALWWQDLILDSEILASAIALLSVIPHALMVLWVGHKIVQGYNGYRLCAQIVLKMLNSMYQTCRCRQIKMTIHNYIRFLMLQSNSHYYNCTKIMKTSDLIKKIIKNSFHLFMLFLQSQCCHYTFSIVCHHQRYIYAASHVHNKYIVIAM